MGQFCAKGNDDEGGRGKGKGGSKAKNNVGTKHANASAGVTSSSIPFKKFSYDRFTPGLHNRRAAAPAPASPASTAATETTAIDRSDPAHYLAANLKQGELWFRGPGSINDQRVTVEGCRGATIIVADQCDSVQVDDCTDCTFFFGPTTGSIFLRTCSNCNFVAICGQMRTRELRNCKFSLFCNSRPVIESSSGIGIGCFTMPAGAYFELTEQFARSRLSPLNNKYRLVHDFTPSKTANYTILDRAATRKILPSLGAATQGAIAETAGDEVVPWTIGSLDGLSEEEDGEPHHATANAAAAVRVSFVCFRPAAFDDALRVAQRLSFSPPLGEATTDVDRDPQHTASDNARLIFTAETRLTSELSDAFVSAHLIPPHPSSSSNNRAAAASAGEMSDSNLQHRRREEIIDSVGLVVACFATVGTLNDVFGDDDERARCVLFAVDGAYHTDSARSIVKTVFLDGSKQDGFGHALR